MAFLHCHSCGWEQDDFWDERYNPLRCPLDWEDMLLNENLDDLFPGDPVLHGEITKRELIARDLERNAQKIRNMKYKSLNEFKDDKENSICPNCGAPDLDID